MFYLVRSFLASFRFAFCGFVEFKSRNPLTIATNKDTFWKSTRNEWRKQRATLKFLSLGPLFNVQAQLDAV